MKGEGTWVNELHCSLGIDKELIVEFLLVFARFEYALKRNPRYARDNGTGVSPYWDRFASDVSASFEGLQEKGLSEAIQYLITHPPKKQVLKRNGVLGWECIPSVSCRLDNLLLSVRTTRNNLFHGGKFPPPDGPLEEPARNETLLRSCLAILRSCLGLDEGVRMQFWGT